METTCTVTTRLGPWSKRQGRARLPDSGAILEDGDFNTPLAGSFTDPILFQWVELGAVSEAPEVTHDCLVGKKIL